MRVYELAQELKVTNQDVIAKLRELGYDVTNHMSNIDESQARKVRSEFVPQEAKPQGVEEERIRRTVIRRRVVKRDDAPAEEAPPAASADEAPAAEEAAEPATEPVATADAVPDSPAAEDAAVEEPAAEAAEAAAEDAPRRKGAARVLDRIAVPAAAVPTPDPRAQPEPGGAPGGDPGRKPRRVVAKRMYRPTKSEEQQLQKLRQSRQKKRGGTPTPIEAGPQRAEKRRIRIDETITVGDLAKAMGVKSGDIIKKFIEMGMLVTINQSVDPDTAGIIASEYGYEVERVGFQEVKFLQTEDQAEDDPSLLAPRPPVVTVMGHVDHGKTSILDWIRKTKVATGEAGGITQHIGAYQVQTKRGLITFIDTPGHQAFTAMRARGADVTDIVVLVVAANDGVMPQTIEAIEHAKAANVPIVVAVNKIDLPDAKADQIRQKLTEFGIVPEEWGGDNQIVHVSAKTGEAMDDLLEAILVQSEVMELKANPAKPGVGIVIESKLDKGRGPVATVIVKAGTLKPSDIVVAGTTFGRVRALLAADGKPLKEAGPSAAAEILGLSAVPGAGEGFSVVENEKIARQIAENRERKQRERDMHRPSRVSLENLFDQMKHNEVHDLALVLKADVQGSLEAIADSLTQLAAKDDKLRLRIVSQSVGAISENDVNLASASGALVIGFNTRPDSKASGAAAELGVEISVYNVIYALIDDVQKALEGMLAPDRKEVSLGWAKVLEIFPIKGIGTIAGSKVESGKFQRGTHVRLVREGQVLYDGKIANLRRFKDDVAEVQTGQECGILLENFSKVRIGDELECYNVIEVARSLGDDA